MKFIQLFVIMLCGFVGGCMADDETGFPVSIGEKSSAVKKILGERDRGDRLFGSYFNHGIVVQYSGEGLVVAVNGTVFETGQQYNADVFGVKIGDKIPKAVELWGEPAAFEHSILFGIDLGDKAYFLHRRYLIKLTLWGKEEDSSLVGRIRDIEIRAFTDEIYGNWYNRAAREYITFLRDGSAKSCQPGKMNSVYSVHGNIKKNGQVLWEGWKNNNRRITASPNEWWSGSEIYLVNGGLVVEGMEKRKTYRRINKPVPARCKF